MKVRRDVPAGPHRDSDAAWQSIVALITGPGSKDETQLQSAAGIASSIIADEHPAEKPIIVEGVGPRLVIYCVYGRKAVSAAEPDGLTWNPTDGDWTMHLPCAADDVAWAKRSLAAKAARVRVYDVADEVPASEASESTSSASRGVNWNIGEI
jgi:hypothetical protein